MLTKLLSLQGRTARVNTSWQNLSTSYVGSFKVLFFGVTKRRSTNLYPLESELGIRIGFLNIITIFCSIGSAADQQGLMGGGAVKYADKTWARAGFDQKPTNYMREGYGKTPNKGKTLLHSIFMEITRPRIFGLLESCLNWNFGFRWTWELYEFFIKWALKFKISNWKKSSRTSMFNQSSRIWRVP